MFIGPTKKKLLGCPQVKFLNIWVGRSDFFIILFFKKHPDYKIWVYFPPFFTKRLNKHPIWQEWCIPDLNSLILFLEMGRSPRATQQFFFFCLRSFQVYTIAYYICKHSINREKTKSKEKGRKNGDPFQQQLFNFTLSPLRDKKPRFLFYPMMLQCKGSVHGVYTTDKNDKF